ncbi:ABC transporter permease subunit [Mycoplasma tauri]|uniref:ABC transporter permease subunit n=1 Tax=Mycoplasma tauri TaxID=547987 RepID=UPI001CBD91E9|nr:ABC transporter permease subunit [Mycoplasma tauri]MBZ4203931.1 ABC transporter permease subunit [Mycoplasma tauri]MBZ4212885.1 ABC transporter permease subunit [Mycoplasma tauri]MBZ4226663.1 ABC transporter permease subunit [Mycoplasma tauri]
MNNNFSLAKKRSPLAPISNYKSPFSLYIKRFFNSKINWLWLGLFLGVVLSLIIMQIITIFQGYSASKPVFDSELAVSLPNYNNPIISKRFEYDDELFKLIQKTNELKPQYQIINKITPSSDIKIVEYNPYAFIEAISGKKYVLFFGTNANKIDRFVFYIHSLSISIGISLLAILIQWLLGTFIGTVIGFYSRKNFGKVGYSIFSALNIFPFLIICLILFNAFGYSHLNAIVIFSFFGSVNFFYISYSNTLNLKNKDYIYAYIASGASQKWILFNVIFRENLWLNITIFADNLSLNILVLGSLAFLKVKNIDQNLNIGAVFNDIIADLNNKSYILFVSIFTSTLIISFKLFSLSLYQASVIGQ